MRLDRRQRKIMYWGVGMGIVIALVLAIIGWRQTLFKGQALTSDEQRLLNDFKEVKNSFK